MVCHLVENSVKLGVYASTTTKHNGHCAKQSENPQRWTDRTSKGRSLARAVARASVAAKSFINVNDKHYKSTDAHTSLQPIQGLKEKYMAILYNSKDHV
jgi:hypothetical protein